MNNNEEQKVLQNKIKNNLKSKIKELDVRPILDSGKDPFKDIMEYIKKLKKDEVFRLVNTFEPFPLYNVLANNGYDHFTEKIDNLFYVYFYKSDQFSNGKENGSEIKKAVNLPNEITNVIEIDVRNLEPPEPMVKILETLDKIDEKSVMLVHHHREPMMLYPKLEERGYRAVTNKIEENYYKVVITKKGNEVDE